MNVLVFLKCVPDTETRIRIAADGRAIDEAEVKLVISPFDEHAIEEALKLKEAAGAGEVTVLTVGDERCQTVLRGALAMGADKAVLVTLPKGAPVDALATARILAAAAKTIPHDLALAGKQGVGNDRSAVPAMVAELVDVPHVAVVTKLEVKDGKLRAEREIEGGQQVVEAELPAIVTCQKGLNQPRYAGIKGVMAAKKKPLDLVTLDKLGLTPAILDEGEQWTKLELPPAREPAKILKGAAADVARELVKLLAEEAKVI